MTTTRRSPGEGGVYSYSISAGQRWRFKCTATLPDGTRKRLHVRGFKTKTEAQKAMREALTASDKGQYSDPSKQPFGAFLADWQEGLTLAPSTIASYRKNIRLHVQPYLGSVPLAQLTPAKLTAHYRQLEKSGRADGGGGLSARTTRYVHTILSAALRDAVDAGQLASNPAAKAKPPTAKQAVSPEMHPWSAAQLNTFLAWAKDSSPLYAAWRLLAYSGMRRGELLALRWRDLDLDAGTVTVRRNATLVRVKGEGFEVVTGPPKSGKPRVVDIDAATVAVLKAHKADRGTAHLALVKPDALVFGDLEGKVRHPEHFSRTWSQTVARAIREGVGVPAIRLHDLRHGHASDLLRAGVPVHVVSQRLGHASPVVTLSIYAHAVPADQKQAADAFAALVAGASS
jgi:integrase